MLDNILLQELKPFKQWVVRQANKVPLNPYTGEAASSTNPATWSDFETAVECCKRDFSLGLGFVLTEKDPFTVIDLDNAADEKNKHTPTEIEFIVSNQQDIFKQFDSYSEISPSGKGLHIWCKGFVATAKRSCVEVYSTGRYMTVTFQPFHNVPVADRQDLLTQLWQDMGGEKKVAQTIILDSLPQTQSDEEICRLASTGANGNGEMFTNLYKGEWRKHFSTQSEADITLCNIVAFYSDNKEQVARIFRNSQLGKRKKAQRDDYLFHHDWGIITKAFDRKGPLIDFSELFKNAKLRNETQIQVEAEAEEEKLIEDEPATIWTLPDGLMGQVCSYIYETAIHPVPEVAISAAIAYLAGIAGRAYNTKTNTGLNQYVVLLARTAGGKEGAASGMDRLTHAVRETVPAFERFIGPADIASPQGLIKQLVDTPCMLSHLGEIGMWLQKLTGKFARSNEINLRRCLLDLFVKSGHMQTLRGSVYSDKAKNVPSIDSPAFSFFGDSTQQEFYKALDENNISEGFVARLTVIESSDARPTYNPNNRVPPSPELTWKLGTLAKRCLELEMLKVPIVVQEEESATKFHEAFREECTDKVFEDRDSIIADIWTRAHLRMLRLAALIAVGCNPDTPVMTLQQAKWAHGCILHGVRTIMKRFESGQVGEVSYDLEQRVLLGKVINRYANSSYKTTWQKQFGITEEMHKSRVVSARYLLLNSYKHACFKNDKNPKNAFRLNLMQMEETGNIMKVDLNKVKQTNQFGTAYYILDLRGL